MTIITAAALAAAFAVAQPGGVIELGAIPTKVALANRTFDPPVTLRGGSIARLQMDKVVGVIFDGVSLGDGLAAGEPDYTQLIRLNGCDKISIRGGAIHGSFDGNPLNDGWGLYVDGGSNISVTGAQISELNRALLFSGVDGVTVLANDFSLIREGVDLVAVSNVLVAENRYDNLSVKAGDHPDPIQLWSTTPLARGSKGIVIRDNLIDAGGASQGIFMTDEASKGVDGVAIMGNLIISTMWQAISVTKGITGVSITDNQVYQVAGASDMTPWINYEPGATVTGNIARRYLPDDGVARGAGFAPPGNTAAPDISQAQADALIGEWLAKYRSGAVPVEPAPDPSPPVVDPVPDPVSPVAPAPTVDLRARLTKARTEINATVNDGRRALYSIDKALEALA